MALTVDFWTYAKQENSTAIPSANPAATFPAILLKEDCSVVNPALQLNVPLTTNLYDYNYCRIREFSRYYFVSDWVWSDGLWIAELEVDVLGSWRTQIGQQSLYVLRAASDYDVTVIDNTYPTTAEAATYTAQAINNPFAGQYANNTGTFIVGIITADGIGIRYYAFSYAGYAQFCTQLFNYSSGWLDIDVTEISENLQKALVNPFQYVTTAFYLPIPVTWFINNSIGTATQTITFGWWSVTVAAGARVLQPGTLYSLTHQLTIPRHPQAATRGSYLNLSPYSFYTLRYYPFGTIDIDSEALAGWNTLDLYTDVDICTGRAILTLAVNGKNNPIRTIESNISAQIPTASVNVDYANLGTKQTVLGAAASAVGQLTSGGGSWWQNVVDKGKSFISNVRTGNWSAIGSGAKTAASNILSSAMAAKATAEITGQQGSFTLYDTQTLTLSGRFLPLVPEDLSHRGRPLCQLRRINMLSGFLMCADADVIIPCTEREKQAIQAYLQSGLYYY